MTAREENRRTLAKALAYGIFTEGKAEGLVAAFEAEVRADQLANDADHCAAWAEHWFDQSMLCPEDEFEKFDGVGRALEAMADRLRALGSVLAIAQCPECLATSGHHKMDCGSRG